MPRVAVDLCRELNLVAETFWVPMSPLAKPKSRFKAVFGVCDVEDANNQYSVAVSRPHK